MAAVNYLVYHVCHKTLDLIRVDRLATTASTNGSLELSERNTCAPDGCGIVFFWLFVASGEEYFAE